MFLPRKSSVQHLSRVFALLALSIFSIKDATADESIDVSKIFSGETLLHIAGLFEDGSRELTIEDIIHLGDESWDPLNEQNIAHPITRSQFWIRVSIENASDQDAALVFQHPTSFIHKVELYDEQGRLISFANGRINPDNREVFDFLPAVQTSLPPNQKQTVYLLISQSFAEPIISNFRLFSPNEYQRNVNMALARDGMMLMTVVVSAFIFLIFSITLKLFRLYLFVGYLTTLSLVIFYYTGLGRWLLPLHLPTHLEPIFPLAYALSTVFLIEFSGRHTNVKIHKRSIFFIYRTITFLMSLYALVMIAGAPNELSVYVSIPALTVPTLCAVVAWWIYITKEQELYILLHAIGITVYTLGMSLVAFFIFSGHPLAMEMHNQGLLAAYSFVSLDIVLLITSISIWFNAHQHHREVAERLAKHDPLTGLLNRRGFEIEINHLLEKAGNDSIWVASLDLDRFKKINDTYGHTSGDAVLVNIASILLQMARVGQVTARFGGEEFVLVFCCSTEEGALEYANAVRERISHKVTENGGVAIHHTTSVGLVPALASTVDAIQTALTQSDQALYDAKQAGRNTVVILKPPSNRGTVIA